MLSRGHELSSVALWVETHHGESGPTFIAKQIERFPAELLDQLVAIGDASAGLQHGALRDSLKKALADRALIAEMDYQLG